MELNTGWAAPIWRTGEHWVHRAEKRSGPLYNSFFLKLADNPENILVAENVGDSDERFSSVAVFDSIAGVDCINTTLQHIHSRLKEGGYFWGYATTCAAVKEKMRRSSMSSFWKIRYLLFFLWHRCFPKISPFFEKCYQRIRYGFPRYITRPEMLGRLCYNGFEIVHHVEQEGVLYFVVRKTAAPLPTAAPSYWPVFKMKRVGANGKMIVVHKFRTMHPYAEFLQDYIKREHGLDTGGKFKNDFRITYWGRLMRKYWLDELPMLFDLLKGTLKLIGVRPISNSYFNLYPQHLQELRKKNKPGLIPPYYVDMPKSLNEIVDSEIRYLEQYGKHPRKTDMKYAWGIFYNIVVKRKRSG